MYSITIFPFSFNVEGDVDETTKVAFCIEYTTPNHGQHWDNNGGSDYGFIMKSVRPLKKEDVPVVEDLYLSGSSSDCPCPYSHCEDSECDFCGEGEISYSSRSSYSESSSSLSSSSTQHASSKSGGDTDAESGDTISEVNDSHYHNGCLESDCSICERFHIIVFFESSSIA